MSQNTNSARPSAAEFRLEEYRTLRTELLQLYGHQLQLVWVGIIGSLTGYGTILLSVLGIGGDKAIPMPREGKLFIVLAVQVLLLILARKVIHNLRLARRVGSYLQVVHEEPQHARRGKVAHQRYWWYGVSRQLRGREQRNFLDRKFGAVEALLFLFIGIVIPIGFLWPDRQSMAAVIAAPHNDALASLLFIAVIAATLTLVVMWTRAGTIPREFGEEEIRELIAPSKAPR